MGLKTFAILAALVAMPAPFAVQAKDDPKPAATSAADQALIRRSIDRGIMIYAYDQAAWHGTDDLMAKARAAGVFDTLAPTIGGWVVDGTAAEPVLVFFDKSERPQAIYTARFADNGRRLVDSKLLGPGDDRTVSPGRLMLIAALRTARAAAEKANFAKCANAAFNTVVLPPETSDGPTLVYFLTPQTQNDAWPFGGHYLVEVKPDGTIGATRPFTKSCITMAKGKRDEAALFITHLLDPVPTEVHVFTAIAASLPVYVGTTQNNLVWVIERVDGRMQIRLVGPAKK